MKSVMVDNNCDDEIDNESVDQQTFLLMKMEMALVQRRFWLVR